MSQYIYVYMSQYICMVGSCNADLPNIVQACGWVIDELEVCIYIHIYICIYVPASIYTL